MNTFVKIYDDNIRPLMDKIDQVRPLLSPSNDGIIFPNVVAVGDQSSGKSTLLESLSLIELPKGNGIVTRCPLVLRLRQSDERKVYRLFDDNRKVLLDEANLNMPQYIEQETRKLAGNHKNIVPDLIELQIEDPHVRDLTVVDLPGIAYNPIRDQPRDIHDQTTNLIRKYISQEGCVILCVFPANVDIVTVESISLAGQVDPSGKRTIGVITKSDLAIDQNMFKQQLLMERPDVVHLKLGFVAVRNRSTDEDISLAAARNREKEFFRQHPVASSVDRNCLGVDALINRLATLYSHRVKEAFPKMRDAIRTQLTEVGEQLSKLPPNLETSAARVAAYNELVDQYTENVLKTELMGSNDSQRTTSMLNTLHQKFTVYKSIIREQRKELFSAEYRSNVNKELSKRRGLELPNFVSSSILKQFICEKLDQLWDVTDRLINECFRTTMNLLAKVAINACKDNVLLSKIINVFRHITDSYINESKTVVHDQLRTLLELDQNDPYTINTFYMHIVEKYKGRSAQENEDATREVPRNMNVPGDDDDDDDELTLIANSTDDQALREMLISIYSYWHMLTKRYIDYAVLSIRAKCVFDVCPNIKKRLRQIPVERCDLIDVHLADDDFIQNRREQLQKTKERLKKACDILHEDDEIVGNHVDRTVTYSVPMEEDSSSTLNAYLQKLEDLDKNK
jgi:hypothetical protein